MATTTPNFGWSVPTSTDLVKDGATAIETLGDSIDASLLDLKGGTSGQVLAKNSNTDMDFIWVAQDDSNAIQNAIVDAKGDLIGATAADTPARLGVGTNGQVLTADSTAATGLAWATPAAGGTSNWSIVNSGGTSLSGAQTVTVSGISGKDKIMVLVENGSSANASSTIRLRLNGDTGNNYYFVSYQFTGRSSYAANIFGRDYGTTDSWPLFTMSASASSAGVGFATITGCSTAGVKAVQFGGVADSAGGTAGLEAYNGQGYWSGSGAVTSISIYSSTGNLDGGTVYVYASA